MTQESILDTLWAYRALVPAHEVFEFLLANEFPDARRVMLLPDAIAEIREMPRSPGEEDPDVSSQEQIMGLLRHYTVGGVMLPKRDYQACDKSLGLWKWKTRTVRLGGMYFGGSSRFIIARAGFARGLKRDGRAVTEMEKQFAAITAARLRTAGLLPHAWKTKDPHDGEALPFNPY